MSKHTQGPWKFDGAEESHGSLEAESLVGADGDIVIRLEDDYPGYPECGEHLIMDIDSANARLIAAAPDLLEALQTTRKNIVSLRNASDRKDAFDPWLQVVVAAIAKATGDTP